MKNTLLSVLCVSFALATSLSGAAQEASETPTSPEPQSVEFAPQEAGSLMLDAFKWQNRVLVVFADSPLDPNFSEQLSLLAQQPEALMTRDFVILTDTDPAAKSPLRTKLRPRGFALVIVDKDGRVMLRKPRPWKLREITHAVDKTPLRQQELRDAKEAARTEG